MEPFFETKGLSVGYRGRTLIRVISLSLEKGTVLTLIGPNGAGKSTILKSITRQLAAIRGTVEIGKRDIAAWSGKEFASTVAVMLTDRVRPELMTCAEVVAMGRYPYTNMLGRLTPQDRQAVERALELVHAQDLARRDFDTLSDLSDGQRQRILLARALCQEPQVLVLDEPTAYLDIRHKIELLDILRQMARQKQMTIVLSLHEIDLAMKVSDLLLCVKGETIHAFGPPEEILGSREIERLYDMEQGAYNQLFGSVELARPEGTGAYNQLFGSVELARPEGTPEVFVVAGAGYGAPVYRKLQKQQIPFATGILFENDVDAQVAARPEGTPEVFVVAGAGYGAPVYRKLQKQQIPFATGILFENDVDAQVAQALSRQVFLAPAFEEVPAQVVSAAQAMLLQCRRVIDAGENDVDAQVAQALSRQVFLAPAFEEVPAQVVSAAQAMLLQCRRVIDAGTPVGTLNRCNGVLLALAESRGIPVERAALEKGR